MKTLKEKRLFENLKDVCPECGSKLEISLLRDIKFPLTPNKKEFDYDMPYYICPVCISKIQLSCAQKYKRARLFIKKHNEKLKDDGPVMCMILKEIGVKDRTPQSVAYDNKVYRWKDAKKLYNKIKDDGNDYLIVEVVPKRVVTHYKKRI